MIELTEAKRLAEENYSTWGQWVIECYTDQELQDELDEHASLKDWVEFRKTLASIYEEREAGW
jgi:hypothetical protein